MVGLVRVPCQWFVSGKAAKSLRRPTSAECEAANADLLRDNVKSTPGQGIVFAHPSYTATDNGNIVFLESFVHGIPDQATPDCGVRHV